MANRGPRIPGQHRKNEVAPRILELLARGAFTPEVMRQRLRVPARSLRYSLKQLSDSGRIVAEGKTHQRIYRLAREATHEAA